ncbi:hypothetical protein PanWU01x14_299670, partial [Parasponia andersonii]
EDCRDYEIKRFEDQDYQFISKFWIGFPSLSKYMSSGKVIGT